MKSRVLAYNHLQFRVFCQNNRLNPNNYIVVNTSEDLRGLDPNVPIIVLPNWRARGGIKRVMWHEIEFRQKTIIHITESQVLGKQPLPL